MERSLYRILLIEDDESITLGLKMNLEFEGYQVDVAHDGESGLNKATHHRYDLIILDLMLPKLNGFEVLKAMQSHQGGPPVIVLSARDAEADKVMGLELGAEDYIAKPFGLAELLARVRVALRRNTRQLSSVEETIEAGDILISRKARTVFRDGFVVELTPTEFDLLLYLVDAQGKALTREEILAAVWGEGHHGTLRTIDNFILQLRAKLEKDAAEPRHLVTVRGFGYKWNRSENTK